VLDETREIVAPHIAQASGIGRVRERRGAISAQQALIVSSIALSAAFNASE
jgi:hypothetical protein